MSLESLEPSRPTEKAVSKLTVTGEPSSESRRRAWGTTWLVVLLNVVNNADKVVFGIIAQPVAHELDLTAGQIGLAGSLFFLTFTLGGFFAGALDKFLTIKWALLLLVLCWSASMLPFVLVGTFGVLILGRLALGLAEGPSMALLHTAVYSWHPASNRGLPGAVLSGGVSIANIAVAPVLAYLSAVYGWRAALVAMTIVGLVWAAIWLAAWKPGPYIAHSSNRKAANAVVVARDTDEPAVPWTRIIMSRTFLAGSLLVMSVYGLLAVILTWLPSYFEVGLGYSRLQAGSMHAFPALAALVLMLSISSLGDRFIGRGISSRTMRIVVPSVAVLVAGGTLGFLPLIKTPAIAVASITIAVGLGASIFPMMNAAISELCPSRQTAGTLGFFLAFMGIGGLVAPYATGVLVEASSAPAVGYATSFQLLGLIIAVAAVITLIFANPDRDKLIIRQCSSRLA